MLLGEDVGRYGGTYAVSKGLLEEFGPERIRDTPISELGFVGIGIGAALNGLRPIVEVMTVNFSLLALDQIVNTASALRHMSNGQFSVPMVVRMATGAGRQLAAQHSHSLENWYAHIPGITVLAPATVADAYGMLRTALTSPDPVIIFEHVGLYNASTDLDELVPTAISGPRSAATGPTPRSSPTAAVCPRSSTPPNNWRRPGSTARSSICGCCGRLTTRPSWSRCGGRTAR